MERRVFGRNRAQGFTLVEVLVASGIAVGVFTAVALFMTLFSLAMTDAGSIKVESTGSGGVTSMPIAPNDTVHALSRVLRTELQYDSINAGLVMAVPGIITPGWPDVDGAAFAVLLAPAGAFATPALFKAQLETPIDMQGYTLADAEVPFTSQPGYSILILNAVMQVRSVTRVTWVDKPANSDTYRLYSVSHTPLGGTPLSYAFAEHETALQAEPGFTFTDSVRGGELILNLPDPSLNLLGSYTQISAQITDPVALTGAKNAISRKSRLYLYAPCFP